LPLTQIVVMEPAHQLLANGSRVSIMKQVLREDIRLHLPRLRQCDEQLISVQGRFGGGGSGGGGGGGGGDPDLQISWSKPAAKADGKWWQELPVLPKIAPGSPAAQVVLQSVATVCETLETVREINMDVVMRMETPEAYLKELPTDATAVVGKVCLLMLSHSYMQLCSRASERALSVCLFLFISLSCPLTRR
jgi:hypothetical protein